MPIHHLLFMAGSLMLLCLGTIILLLIISYWAIQSLNRLQANQSQQG